jgi:hypothetical protein
MPPTMKRAIQNPGLHPWTGRAVYDRSRKYRTRLTRVWDESLGVCNFCMLNPSTATAQQNDPTVRRALGYAQRWGFGTLVVTNIFALRSTCPKQLYTSRNPVGPGNDRAILDAAKEADLLVAAWGNHCNHLDRATHIINLLRKHTIDIHCLNTTKQGQPVHPLYQRGDAGVILFLT